MKRIARTTHCLMALIALLLCLPLMAQGNDESKSTEEPAKKDGVITTSSMEERLQAVESDGSVITTTKMEERLESAGEGGTVITNSKLAEEAAAAAAPGAFTNEHLGTKDDGEEADGDAAVEDEAPEGDETDADADTKPNAERDRLIGEIEAELDSLAARVRELEGDSSEARLRETESRIEELRKAVDALKKSD